MNLQDHLKVQLKSNFFKSNRTIDDRDLGQEGMVTSGPFLPRHEQSQLLQMAEEQYEDSEDEYNFTDNQFKSRFPKLRQKTNKGVGRDEQQPSALDFIPTKHQQFQKHY